MRSNREIVARMIHRSSTRLRTAESLSTMRLMSVFRESVRPKTTKTQALGATTTKTRWLSAKTEICGVDFKPPLRYISKKQGFPVRH